MSKIVGVTVGTPLSLSRIKSEIEPSIEEHENNKKNPHGVTADQVGARPNTWMPTAEDVGARPNTWMPTASDVGARPSSWMPSASDVGARPSTWTPSAAEVGAVTESQVSTMINDALGVIENGTY